MIYLFTLEEKKVKDNCLTYISEYEPLMVKIKNHYHIKCESFIIKMNDNSYKYQWMLTYN